MEKALTYFYNNDLECISVILYKNTPDPSQYGIALAQLLQSAVGLLDDDKPMKTLAGHVVAHLLLDMEHKDHAELVPSDYHNYTRWDYHIYPTYVRIEDNEYTDEVYRFMWRTDEFLKMCQEYDWDIYESEEEKEGEPEEGSACSLTSSRNSRKDG